MKNSVIGSCLLMLSSGLFAAGKAPAKGQKPAPAPAAPKQEATPVAPAVTSMPAKAAAPAERWGMAGCGLGSLIIKNDSMGPQIGAWFLNGLGFQTSALTSGSSNCVQNRTDVAAMEQQVYFNANLSSISKEAAQGSGEHIAAVAEVFGCQDATDAQRLGALSQRHYAEIFAQKEPAAVLQQYLTVVSTDPQLAKSCGKAS